MTFEFGKSIFGGRELSPEELRRIPQEELEAVRGRYIAPEPVERTSDTIDQRLAEELHTAKRMVEAVKDELDRRSAQYNNLDEADDLIEDIAKIIDAADDCEAIGKTDPDLRRRLTRRSLDGKGTRCDNQAGMADGSRIRRKGADPGD